MLLGRGSQSPDEQIHAVLVLDQQGGRRLVVLPQDQVHELGLGAQQGGGVWAALLQEAIQDRKQGCQDGLRAEEETRVKEALRLGSNVGVWSRPHLSVDVAQRSQQDGGGVRRTAGSLDALQQLLHRRLIAKSAESLQESTRHAAGHVTSRSSHPSPQRTIQHRLTDLESDTTR